MNMAETLRFHHLSGELRRDEPMARHVSWRTGGRADRVYIPADIHDLAAFLRQLPDGEPLLSSVMKEGRRLAPSPALDDIRKQVTTGRSRLPDWMRELDHSSPYDVRISQALHDLADSVDHCI